MNQPNDPTPNDAAAPPAIDSSATADEITPPADREPSEATTGITVWTLMTNFVIALFVGVLLIAAYHAWLAPKQPRFGKINLSEVLEIKQLQFSLGLLNADLANKAGAREDAINQVARVGQDVEKALNDVSASCNCTLLVTGAVLSSQLQDYTPDLKALLGIKEYNLEAMRKRAQDAILTPKPGESQLGVNKQ